MRLSYFGHALRMNGDSLESGDGDTENTVPGFRAQGTHEWHELVACRAYDGRG